MIWFWSDLRYSDRVLPSTHRVENGAFIFDTEIDPRGIEPTREEEMDGQLTWAGLAIALALASGFRLSSYTRISGLRLSSRGNRCRTT